MICGGSTRSPLAQMPNFEVWFGADVIQVMLLKGALAIAEVNVYHVMGSAVGFEDSSYGLTLSVEKVRPVLVCARVPVLGGSAVPVLAALMALQVLVRDLRQGAKFPVVFDVWHDKVAADSGHYFGIQDLGLAYTVDESTAATNTELDPAVLRDFFPLAEGMPMDHRGSFGSAAEEFKDSASFPDRLEDITTEFAPMAESFEDKAQNRRVTEALRRIEDTLHLENAADRTEATHMEYQEDSAESRAYLMSGVNLDVDDWDSSGTPLPAAHVWKSTFQVVSRSELRSSGDSMDSSDLRGSLLPLVGSDTKLSVLPTPPVEKDASLPMLHIRVRVCLFELCGRCIPVRGPCTVLCPFCANSLRRPLVPLWTACQSSSTRR